MLTREGAMKIQSVEISNFKAIKHAKLDLHPTFNVLVGSNGSGKSSVLQALHWMLQSGRNQVVKPGAPGKASTLSEKDAIFMPSAEYQSAGHGADYGNFKSNPQLDLRLVAVGDDGAELKVEMWLKAARNEGISVHVPANNQFVGFMRDRKREISAYIPGLAGIPLVEEKRSRVIVHRSAAAGDANTVLRNMLDLLRKEDVGGRNGLDLVSELVARVMGDFALKVDFDDERHARVFAAFRVGEMGASGSFRPLELAGIGYLQVLQIFCYLVYFRPVLLLVDEPDAHLYPIAQERLVEVLHEVAEQFDSQVILTTHSPSIVRALPQDSTVIWMKDGKVDPSGDSNARQLMGWGLLDRKIILLTEDARTEMLRALIGQWPDLERSTAIWPLHGTGKLPSAETLAGFQSLVGPKVKIIVHRDRDFLMPLEAERFADPYRRLGHQVWFTKHSDVESYWATPGVVAHHFDIATEDAIDLLTEATSRANADGDAKQKVRRKRNEVWTSLNRDGSLPQYGDDAVFAEATRDGKQFAVLGKNLMSCLREVATQRGLPGANTFGKNIPQGARGMLAEDLGVLLNSCI